MRQQLSLIWILYTILLSRIQVFKCLELDLQDSSPCMTIQTIGGNQASITSIVYIKETTLVSVSDSQGYSYIYDAFDGKIHQTTTTANPPILGQIFYPNLLQATLSQQRFSVVDLLSKQEIVGIQSLDQDISYVSLISADISKIKQEQQQGGSAKISCIIILNNRKTQTIQIKPSSQENNFYPQTDSYDYLIQIKGLGKGEQGIFGNNQNQINQYQIIEDYTITTNQNFPNISPGGRTSLMLAINSGAFNSVYSYLINFSQLNQQKPVDQIQPVILPASVYSFTRMNSSNLLLISYGAATKFQQKPGGGGGNQNSSPLLLKENNLCVYDFGSAKNLQGTSYGVDVLPILQNPIVCISMGSNPITEIQNIQMNNNKNYIIFSLLSQSFVIFENSDLIKNNFSIANNNMINISSYMNGSITTMLLIPNTSILIVGTTQGLVASFDISNPNLISQTTQQSSQTLQITSRFNNIGIGQRGQVLSDIIFDTSSQTIIGITKNSGQQQQGLQQTLFQYNLKSQIRIYNFTRPYLPSNQQGGQQGQQITLEQSIVFSTPSFLTLTSVTRQYYLNPNPSKSCPQQIPSPTPTFISVKILSLANSSQQFALDVQTDNQNPIQISGMLSYTLESNPQQQFAVILLVTQPFPYNAYCVQNQRQNRVLLEESAQEQLFTSNDIYDKNRFLQQSQINLNIYIVNSTGVSVFKTDNSFYSLASTIQAPIQFIKDSQQNMFIVFQNSFMVVKPSANTPLNIQTKTIAQEQIQVLTQLSDIAQIQKINFLTPINSFFMQLTMNDGSLVTVLISYNQFWFQDQNQNLQLTMIGIINSSSDVSVKNLINYNSIFYMQSQNVLVVQKNTNLYFLKYNTGSNSFSLQLTLSNISDNKSTFFQISSDNSLYMVLGDGEIKRIIADQCLSQGCFNTVCSINTLLNIQSTNSLSDIYKNAQSNTLIRQEQIYNQVLDYQNFINKISNITVKRNFYFEGGSVYNIQYTHYQQLVSQQYLKQNKINLILNIRTAFTSQLSNPDQNNLNVSPIQIYGDYSSQFDDYVQISFRNIQWNVNFENYQDPSQPLIQIKNQISYFEKFSISTFSIKNPSIVIDNFNQFQILQGSQAFFKNMNILNKNYNKARFLIQVPQSSFSLTLENIMIQNCKFESTVFISASDQLTLNAQNIQFINNKITLPQDNQEKRTFISAQIIKLEKFIFQNNVVELIPLIGKTESSLYFQANITNLDLSQNAFFIDESSINNLFLDVEFLSAIQSTTYLNLASFKISQNKLFAKKYDLSTFNDYLTSLNYNQNQQPPDNQINDLDVYINPNQESQNFFFNTKYIQTIQIEDVNITDNTNIGFYQSSYLKVFKANQIKYKNTWLNQQQLNSACIKITEYNVLSFELTNVFLENLSMQNEYLIYLKTSQFYSANLKQLSYFNIDGLSAKNIKISTSTEYNQASIIFLNSLQQIKISINKLNVQNILLQTPLKVFYDMASALSVLAPFSQAVITNSNFLNFYTQSIKEVVFLNVQDLIMDKNNFENNQFQTNAPLIGTNGGFMLIQSKSLNMTNNYFFRGSSLNGAALTITPTSSNSNFNIKNCQFSNLISFQYGGAVYINNPPANTTVSIQECQFTSLIASEGGSIYSYYTVNKALNENIPQKPIINISQIRVNQTFASSQGSFIYLQNIKSALDDFQLDLNDPNKYQQSQIQQQILIQQLNQFQAIASIFSVFNSDLVVSNSKLQRVFSKSNQKLPSVLNLQQKSYANLSNFNVTEGSYSNGGALLVDTQSQIKINFVQVSQLRYQKPISSMRLIQETSKPEYQLTQSQLQSLTISTFMIRGSSQFQIYQLTMNENQCTNLFCVGGGLSLVDSKGIIDESTFTNNFSQNKGGGISLISVDGQVEIRNSKCLQNNAYQEGGGLFIYQNVDQIQPNNKILIQHSKFLFNNALQGGGLYLNSFSLTNNVKSIQWIEISDSEIMNNKASFLGGGMQYTGFDPYIASSTKISSNTAGKNYGGDLFSRPFKLKFNQDLTKKSNQNNVEYEIKYDQNLKMERLQLGTHVSGGLLPHLIFELVDENNQVIDSSYQSIIGSQIYAQIQTYGDFDEKNAFQISSSLQKISFTNFFNLTDITITGIPNSSISIQLSTPFTNNPNYPENNYYFIIDIYLRQCVQGEVFKKGLVVHQQKSFTIYGCSECPSGQYSLAIPDLKKPIFECQKCIANSDCKGGNVISIKQGFWRQNNQTDEIYRCINKENNCQGGTQNFTCNTGHIGPLCESCDIENGYSREGDFQCSVCGDIVNNTFKVIGLIMLYVVCAKLSVDGVLSRVMFIIKRKKEIKQQAEKLGATKQFIKNQINKEEVNASILLKLIISYFQIIMVITTFQISFPSYFNSPIDAIGNPTVQVLYSFECFFHNISVQIGVNIIYVQFIASVCLPILCVLVFIFTGLIKYRNNAYLKRFYISTSLIYCLMYFQPSIYKDAISILSCRSIGNQKYIQYNVLYTCDTDDHILWSLSLILPILLLISVFIPGFIMYKVYKSKDSFLKRKNYTFIIGEYEMNDKKKIWYWEFIKMYMKLLIMSILIIYEYSIPNKILFILLIVVLYGFFLVKIQPYSGQLYNKIDIYSTFVLTTSIYLAFIAYENKENNGWLLSSIIGIALLNFVFLCWCFKKLLLAYIPIMKKTYFEFKFLCFKLSPCQCFYSKQTATIYKFQKLVKLVQNELKKRNIINAWTGKIKVPLENIIDLIIQGREQMKNGSKLDLNTSMKNKSQAKIVSAKKINLQSEKQIAADDYDDHNKIQMQAQFQNQIKSENQIESVNLDFPSENLIAFQSQNQSINQMVAHQMPQSYLQNEEFRVKINKLKSTSIIQDFGTNRHLLEIAPISSRFEDNIGTYRNIQSPMNEKSTENDQITSLKRLIYLDNTSPKSYLTTIERQIQNQNQIILETPNDSEHDQQSIPIPMEYFNIKNENTHQNVQKLKRSMTQQEIQRKNSNNNDIENQLINKIQNNSEKKSKDSIENEDNYKLSCSIEEELNSNQNNQKEMHIKKLCRDIQKVNIQSQNQESKNSQNLKIEERENLQNFESNQLMNLTKSSYDILQKEQISPESQS